MVRASSPGIEVQLATVEGILLYRQVFQQVYIYEQWKLATFPAPCMHAASLLGGTTPGSLLANTYNDITHLHSYPCSSANRN